MNITNTKGPALMLLSAFLFAVMGIFVKLATPYASANEIAFVRFIIGIIATLVLVGLGKVSLVTTHKKLLVARGIFGGLAIILFYGAIKTSSLTNVTVLHNTYPLFAAVYAAIYLKEKLRPGVVIPILTSVVGIALLTQPSLETLRSGEFLALCSAVLAGFSIVVVRQLRQTESAWLVFFYLSIFGALFSLAIAISEFTVPSPVGMLYMFIAGIIGTMAQVIMTVAYKYCLASVGSVISMSTVVFSAIFGMSFLGERLSLVEGIGALVVLISCGYIAYGKPKQAEQEVAEQLTTDN